MKKETLNKLKELAKELNNARLPDLANKISEIIEDEN